MFSVKLAIPKRYAIYPVLHKHIQYRPVRRIITYSPRAIPVDANATEITIRVLEEIQLLRFQVLVALLIVVFVNKNDK
jgi:hypothetical protein